MQPRTKKGPSWKDDDPVPGPVASSSTGATSELPKRSKPSKELESSGEISEQQATQADAVSDLDWLKRHTKTTLDDVETPGRVFEQSDDEDAQGATRRGEQEVR